MYDKRHGGPYDRGGADSYYRRGYNPHYFTGATYQSPEVPMHKMTAEEITFESRILVNIFDMGFEMGGLAKTLFTKTVMKNK